MYHPSLVSLIAYSRGAANVKQEFVQLTAALNAKKEEFKMKLNTPQAANNLRPIDTVSA